MFTEYCYTIYKTSILLGTEKASCTFSTTSLTFHSKYYSDLTDKFNTTTVK